MLSLALTFSVLSCLSNLDWIAVAYNLLPLTFHFLSHFSLHMSCYILYIIYASEPSPSFPPLPSLFPFLSSLPLLTSSYSVSVSLSTQISTQIPTSTSTSISISILLSIPLLTVRRSDSQLVSLTSCNTHSDTPHW